MKDYIKVIITALVTALVTITVSGFINRETKIRNSATKEDITILKTTTNEKIEMVKTEAFLYTDNQLTEHKTQENAKDQMLMKYMDQRFTDIEKLIRAINN